MNLTDGEVTASLLSRNMQVEATTHIWAPRGDAPAIEFQRVNSLSKDLQRDRPDS